MGSVVLEERAKGSWLDGLNIITAGASSSRTLNTECSSDTLNDPLSFMGDQEGQVKTVHAGQPGSKWNAKCKNSQHVQDLGTKGSVEEVWNVQPHLSGDS